MLSDLAVIDGFLRVGFQIVDSDEASLSASSRLTWPWVKCVSSLWDRVCVSASANLAQHGNARLVEYDSLQGTLSSARSCFHFPDDAPLTSGFCVSARTKCATRRSRALFGFLKSSRPFFVGLINEQQHDVVGQRPLLGASHCVRFSKAYAIEWPELLVGCFCRAWDSVLLESVAGVHLPHGATSDYDSAGCAPLERKRGSSVRECQNPT